MKGINCLFNLIALLTFGAGHLASAQSFLTNGLVLYYPFSGNANDASGSSNDGIVTGATLGTNRLGVPSDSYVFKATGTPPTWGGDYVSTTTSAGLPVVAQDFTISVWLKLSSNSPDYQIIFCNRSINQFQLAIVPLTGETQLGAANGELWFHIGNDTSNGGPPQCHAGVTWTLNQWYNVQLVRSGNALTMYRNGNIVAQSSTTLGNNASASDRILDFGYRTSPAGHPLWGNLDDIRFYNRALSASELQQLYDYESGPRVNFVKAFTVDVSSLVVGTKYQLQSSTDMSNWNNYGAPFVAASVNYTNTDYQRIDQWYALFFRLVVVP